jgi:hypothetical protein
LCRPLSSERGFYSTASEECPRAPRIKGSENVVGDDLPKPPLFGITGYGPHLTDRAAGVPPRQGEILEFAVDGTAYEHSGVALAISHPRPQQEAYRLALVELGH